MFVQFRNTGKDKIYIKTTNRKVRNSQTLNLERLPTHMYANFDSLFQMQTFKMKPNCSLIK